MIIGFNGRMPKIADSAFISETATIIGDVEIGENSGVWPGTVIRGDFAKIKIGMQTIIEDNCVVHCGEPMEIGNNVTIGHGVVVHGKTIGNNNLIGNNATILDNSEIADYCVIGAGCLVSPGMIIPDRSLVFGIPAKVTGQVKPRHLERLERGNLFYLELFKHYKEAGI